MIVLKLLESGEVPFFQWIERLLWFPSRKIKTILIWKSLQLIYICFPVFFLPILVESGAFQIFWSLFFIYFGGGRESQAGSALSAQSSMWCWVPETMRSYPDSRSRVGHLTDWATQEPLKYFEKWSNYTVCYCLQSMYFKDMWIHETGAFIVCNKHTFQHL